jgi:hypothetical protein
LFAPGSEETIGADHERTCSQFDQGCERGVDLAFAACMEDMELQPESVRHHLQFFRCAGTNIATEAVVRAPADGYTLLLANAANAIKATLYEVQPIVSDRPFPNSSPMPKPIRGRSPWRRPSAFVPPRANQTRGSQATRTQKCHRNISL